MTDITSKNILENGVIKFYSGKKEYNSLSNFWACKIIIYNEYGNGERVYESGEHCFHGEKYYRIGNLCLDENRKRELLNYSDLFLEGSNKTAAEIKRMGGKKGLLLNNDELCLWNTISLEVQHAICNYKFENYEKVKEDIIKSGNRILIHPALRCSVEKVKTKFWEGRTVFLENGEVGIVGGNMLGKIWMDLRMRI